MKVVGVMSSCQCADQHAAADAGDVADEYQQRQARP